MSTSTCVSIKIRWHMHIESDTRARARATTRSVCRRVSHYTEYHVNLLRIVRLFAFRIISYARAFHQLESCCVALR